MATYVFTPVAVTGGATVRFDTASGSDSPATIYPLDYGQPIPGAKLRAHTYSGNLPQIESDSAVLYQKTLDYRGVTVTATTTLTGVAQATGNPTGTVADISAALSGTYAPLNGKSRLTGPSFPHWRAALSKARSGAADARILCIGDSTTFGYGGSNTTQHPLNSYTRRLADLLNSYFAPSTSGLALPVASGSSSDTRWTLGTGWALDGSNNGWAGIAYKAAASSGALVFAPGTVAGSCDTFDVYYVATGASAAFTIQATGGSATTVTPGSQDGVFKATCTAASAATNNTVSITTGTGTARIVGVEARLSTAKRVLVGNAGVSGSTAAQWNTSVSNVKYGGTACIKTYAPDLTIIDLGINDAASSGNTAAYAANLAPLIAAAQISGDVILKTFVPSYNDGTLGPNEATILPLISAAASTYGCGLIDTNSRWVSYPVSNPLGYYFDVLHPNDVGYGDIAQHVFSSITSI